MIEGAGLYVAAAYGVFLALLLAYVAIMASRLVRVERELAELDRLTTGASTERVRPGQAVSS
jgi:hypothetical protein